MNPASVNPAPENPVPGKKRRSLTSRALKLAGILLLLAAAAHLLVLGALYTDAANRYLAARLSEWMPALSLTSVRGNLVQGLAFDLTYRGEVSTVALSDGRLRIAPRCLWARQLCIEEFSAQELRIARSAHAVSGAEQADKSLPTVRVPLPIRVRRLRLQRLTIEDVQRELFSLEKIRLRGSWHGERIRIKSAHFAHQHCRGRLSGEIQLRDFYPLYGRATCDAGELVEYLSADLDGDLNRLDIAADTHIPVAQARWPLRAALQLSPLHIDQALSADIELRQGVTLIDRQLQLHRARLQLGGTLDQLTADLSLRLASPHWQEDSELRMKGTLGWRGQPTPRVQVSVHHLRGSLLQQPLGGSADIVWQPHQLQVEALELHLQGNRLRAQGLLAVNSGNTDTDTDNTGLAVELELPELRQLWPPLRGALTGRLRLSGVPARPDIRGRLQAQALAYRDFHAQGVSLQLRLAQLGREPGELTLRLQQLSSTSLPLGDIELTARGTRLQHRLTAHWYQVKGQKAKGQNGNGQQADGYRGRLACDGEWQPNRHWRGRCPSLALSAAGLRWALVEDSLQVHHDPEQSRWLVEPVCLHSLGARLCSEQAIATTGTTITGLALTGSQLPWTLFERWADKRLQLQGHWRFRLEGEYRHGRAVLDMAVASRDARLKWRLAGDRPLSVSVAQLRLDGERLELSGSAETREYGRVRGGVTLDGEVIEGSLEIAEARLAPLAPLLPLGDSESTELTGRLDGEINISGKRLQPRLHGAVNVREARLALAQLPLPLEAIRMAIEFDDRRARLRGDFSVADAPGRLTGEVLWGKAGWRGDLSVDAEQLPLRLDDNTQVTLSPSVSLTLTPARLDLRGRITIPRARVKLKQLPARAVSPSPDSVIVDRGDAPEGTLPEPEPGFVQVSSELTLVLGDDVEFQGFGLDTRLRGRLQFNRSPARGDRANGVISLYQGRYRAYGQALAIRHGDLIFVGDPDNPQLRIEAVRELQDDTLVVGVRAAGPARQPTISLFSVPEMPQQAKLHYLLTGQAPGVDVAQDSNYLAAQAALALGIHGSDSALDKTAQALGIDHFRISAESGHSGPEMNLSGYLGSNLLVRYGIGVFEAVNSLTLRYKLGRNLYLEAVSGPVNSLDLLWSFER